MSHTAAARCCPSRHLRPASVSGLLVRGFATRFAALALPAMTAVIQTLVYPDAWPTHLSWAGLMLYPAGREAGPMSLDHALGFK